jgi:hypothetical protein
VADLVRVRAERARDSCRAVPDRDDSGLVREGSTCAGASGHEATPGADGGLNQPGRGGLGYVEELASSDAGWQPARRGDVRTLPSMSISESTATVITSRPGNGALASSGPELGLEPRAVRNTECQCGKGLQLGSMVAPVQLLGGRDLPVAQVRRSVHGSDDVRPSRCR